MQIIKNNKKYTLFARKNKNNIEIQGISKDNEKIKINDIISSNTTQTYQKGNIKTEVNS